MLPDVRGAYVNEHVSSCGPRSANCYLAFVGTCDDLRSVASDAIGCRDDRMSWIDGGLETTDAQTITWHSEQRPRATRTTLAAPDAGAIIASPSLGSTLGDILQANVFVPATTPEIAPLLDIEGPQTITVQADPGGAVGHRLAEDVSSLLPTAVPYPMWDTSAYEFVAGMRALVWAVAAVVLAIGLLGFVVATMDRVVSRRAEMVSLQVVGTPRHVIRAAQWWEAALPIGLGLPLAIGLGWCLGSVYLALGGALDARPSDTVASLVAVSVVAGVAIAGLTVVASAPRIRAELIRRN